MDGKDDYGYYQEQDAEAAYLADEATKAETEAMIVQDKCESEVWDWTKLNSYACMLRGHYAMEEHLRPKEPNEALAFGIAFHKMVEVWMHETITKVGTATPGFEMKQAQQAFLAAWEKELPQQLREKLELEGNRRSYANACRLFEAYTRKFPIKMFDKIVAVEFPFTLPLGITPSGRYIYWSGILDRVVRWQGELYYVEVKTSSYPIDEKFFNKFRYNGQSLGYAWVGERLGYGCFAGIMVHGVEVKVPQVGIKLRKDGQPYAYQGRQAEELIQSDIITIYPNMLKEWKQKVLWKIDRIQEARKAGYWEPNMGDICAQFNGCDFTRLCYSPSDLRETRKVEHYSIKKWNPLTREEI